MVTGLSTIEAAQRLAQVGPNQLVPAARWRRLRAIAETIADPMAIMLAITAAVYLALGETGDAIVLAIALVPVLGVDVLLEARSHRALAALRDAVAPTARVIRDGRERAVATATLVPGDVLVLAEGDLVFADARVLDADHLALDESHLTGESEPQERGAGAPLVAGARVLAGRAHAEVTVTGAATSYGKVAALVAGAIAGTTPLQRRITSIAWKLAGVAIAIATLVFALELARGQALAGAFLVAISFAMAAMPEEFPLVFTMFLSLGAWRLARRGVLVRRLVGVESLGATTVICTDKTGTLTEGRFVLAAHDALGGDDDALLEAAALACEPAPDDAMERAIVAHCAEHGLAVAAGRRLVGDHPLEPAGRHMTHVWQDGDRWTVVMKGALEGVLEHCTGAPPVAPRMSALAEQGMRVLAVARRDGTGALPIDRAAAEAGMTLLGLIGFRDPLRPEAAAAVAACRAAGIELKMLTGDHALTARAIARAAGLEVGERVLTGEDTLDLAAIRGASVIARVRPEQKLAIVDALVGAGEVVAMTGDGINDAPALRRASIGISMGKRATEVARDASGLVLLGDDLGAVVTAIGEGRRIFGNLQRAFLFLMAFHVPIIGLALLAPLLGLPQVLLPVHLVWLELVLHPISALVFEAEPAPANVMTRPPRRPGEPMLPARLLVRSLVSGAVVTAGALALFAARQDAGAAVARTAALTAVIAGGLAIAWAERAFDQPWWRAPLPRTARFWIVMGVVAASLPLAIAIPPVAAALRVAPIGARDVALALAIALAAIVWRGRADLERPVLVPGSWRLRFRTTMPRS